MHACVLIPCEAEASALKLTAVADNDVSRLAACTDGAGAAAPAISEEADDANTPMAAAPAADKDGLPPDAAADAEGEKLEPLAALPSAISATNEGPRGLDLTVHAGLAANGDELPAPAGSSSNGAQPDTAAAPGTTGSVRSTANGALSGRWEVDPALKIGCSRAGTDTGKTGLNIPTEARQIRILAHSMLRPRDIGTSCGGRHAGQLDSKEVQTHHF